jgi:predicted nucleic acid binding AN1-type Zn finger protein
VISKYGQFADVRVILSSRKKYFANACNYCKNYIYLSSLECLYCHKNLCEFHLGKCDCTIKPAVKKWVLVVRQLNADRQMLKELVPLIGVR